MVLRKLRPTRAGRCRRISSMIDLVGRFGIGLVEHHALVTGAFEHRGKRHDADRRESHDADVAVGGARGRRQRVELWIADVDEKYEQWSSLGCAAGSRTVTVLPQRSEQVLSTLVSPRCRGTIHGRRISLSQNVPVEARHFVAAHLSSPAVEPTAESVFSSRSDCVLLPAPSMPSIKMRYGSPSAASQEGTPPHYCAYGRSARPPVGQGRARSARFVGT